MKVKVFNKDKNLDENNRNTKQSMFLVKSVFYSTKI